MNFKVWTGPRRGAGKHKRTRSWGAHAAGVLFAAARREAGSAPVADARRFSPSRLWIAVGAAGGPPAAARGPRALPGRFGRPRSGWVAPLARRAFWWLFLSLGCHLAQPAWSQTTNRPPVTTLDELRARLTEHISQPRFAPAMWGIKAVSLDTGLTLFEHNAGKLLKPASNAKLFTGALALDRLGPDYRIKTSFYSIARPNRSGTLDGDLIVFGRGDPSFAARFNDGDHSKSLAPLVEVLVAAGVKRIKGDLVGDESYFRGPPFGSSWTWDDLQYYYGAEVSALTQEDNVVDLVFKPGAKAGAPCLIETRPATGFLTFINQSETIDADGRRDINLRRSPDENTVHVSGQLPLGTTNWNDAVAVHNPARWFVTRLKEELDRRGVKISGKVRTVDWQERQAKPIDHSKLFEVASVESRPMSEVATKMMKPSQNLYAQLLLLQVGAVVEGRRQKERIRGRKPNHGSAGNRRAEEVPRRSGN